MKSSSKGNGVSGGRAGGIGASDGDGSNRNNNDCSSDGGSFVKRISEMFMKWKVRPDIVLRGRHENKSKGALSAFWQVRACIFLFRILRRRFHPLATVSGSVMLFFRSAGYSLVAIDIRTSQSLAYHRVLLRLGAAHVSSFKRTAD